MGVDNGNKWALEKYQENSLAMDVAAGIPLGVLKEKYGFPDRRFLGQVLEKPRVKALVEGYKASIGDAVVRLHNRMAIESMGILEEILESARSVDCPHKFSNARYVLDKLLPNVSYVQNSNHHTVDVEVYGQFNEGAKALGVLVGKGDTSGFDIDINDPHLHDGKEFIDARDTDLSGLGKDE